MAEFNKVSLEVAEVVVAGLQAGGNDHAALVVADMIAELEHYRSVTLTLTQRRSLALVEERWPGDDPARRGLALCEEAGEVARCILKADANHSGYRSETDWAHQLEVEAGQVAFVLCTIAEANGFSLAEALLAAVADVEAKPTAAEREVARLGCMGCGQELVALPSGTLACPACGLAVSLRDDPELG